MNNPSVFGGGNNNAFGGGGNNNGFNANGGASTGFGSGNNARVDGGGGGGGGGRGMGGNNNNWNGQKKGVCKFWQQGRCNYGDSCKFEHPGANNGGASGGGMNTGGGGQGGFQQNNAFGGNSNGFGMGGNDKTMGVDNNNRSRDNGRPVCKHWLKGSCQFGPENCKFLHPAADEELILIDLMKEIPQWPLTSYGRAKKETKVAGDVSPEELRVSSYLAGFAGESKDAIGARESQAVQAQKQKFMTIIEECKYRENAAKAQYSNRR